MHVEHIRYYVETFSLDGKTYHLWVISKLIALISIMSKSPGSNPEMFLKKLKNS